MAGFSVEFVVKVSVGHLDTEIIEAMRSLVRFGVNQPVPVNLLMVGFIIAGIVAGLSLRREFFPESTPEQALISLPYPGATPEEIESDLARKVEDALDNITEIKEIRTTVFEGAAGVTAEFFEGEDPDLVLDEIERAIDSLQDLPQESENITAQLLEPRLPVIRVAVFGELDEVVMKEAARAVKDDLESLSGMGEIIIDGVRDYEIRVDVDSATLIDEGISLPEIANAVRGWMIDIPGGTVRSSGGDIKVRTMGVSEQDDAIADIVIRADAEGRAVRLGDIAKVSESFVEDQIINRFNGKPAAILTVFKVGDQDIVKMAERVRAYILGRNGEDLPGTGLDRILRSHMVDAWELGRTTSRPLPEGVSLMGTSDLARFVEGRLDLLVRNALAGAALVFATLLLFLNARVAFWVGVGLVTAVLGTLVLMGIADITLNLLTMFGLIVVLGLLVDDAIVVSENIQSRHDRGESAIQAAVHGAEQVFWPVVATVLTSIVAFLPLTFIKGQIGDLLGALPWVVACALAMSLAESLLILPSHMGHSLAAVERKKRRNLISRKWRAYEKWRDEKVMKPALECFGRMLRVILTYRYVSACGAFAILFISLGLIGGKYVTFTFLANDDAETLLVDMQLPIGTPLTTTNELVKVIEDAAFQQAEVKTIAAQVGQSTNIDTGNAESASPHIAQIFIELVATEERDVESSIIQERIREATAGKLLAAERVSWGEISGGPAGPDISIQLIAPPGVDQTQAVRDVKNLLRSYDGVFDISDNTDLGQLEMQVHLRNEAAGLGFTQLNVNEQIRGYLFGLEAHTFSANEEDIDVRVRVDPETRRSLFRVENSWLLNPQGDAVPLSEIADINDASSYTTIRRTDGNRSTDVTADVAVGISPEDIVGDLTAAKTEDAKRFGIFPYKKEVGPSPLDQIRQKHPKVEIKFSGRQEQLGDAFASLPIGMAAAVLMIYIILAWLFGSYFQPLVVLSVVPFGIVGVSWGHFLLGYDMTFLSLIGFVALSGIIVNDSLIYVEFYNGMRKAGESVIDSLVDAGRARFRAILLTTITTVLGLTPLILEQSFQAKFLIPMAISIAGGLLTATFMVLMVLPCFMMIFNDLQHGAYRLWNGRAMPHEQNVRVDIFEANLETVE